MNGNELLECVNTNQVAITDLGEKVQDLLIRIDVLEKTVKEIRNRFM